MGTGARRNPPPLHERVRDLSRIEIAYVERHDRRARRLVKGAVELDFRNLTNTGEKAIGQGAFVSRNRFNSTLSLNKIKACGKARYAMTVERARLKTRGPLDVYKRQGRRAPRPPSGPQ